MTEPHWIELTQDFDPDKSMIVHFRGQAPHQSKFLNIRTKHIFTIEQGRGDGRALITPFRVSGMPFVFVVVRPRWWEFWKQPRYPMVHGDKCVQVTEARKP